MTADSTYEEYLSTLAAVRPPIGHVALTQAEFAAMQTEYRALLEQYYGYFNEEIGRFSPADKVRKTLDRLQAIETELRVGVTAKN